MYDSLEGLHYKKGECSGYVSRILKNLQKSIDNKDIVFVDEAKVGDVLVLGYSSHLIVKEDDRFHPTRISTKNKHGEKLMVIPSSVLDRLRSERM